MIAVSIAQGATAIPPMQVTVTNAAGKVAYKGTTSANGTFTTGALEPGNYVVQFVSKAKSPKGIKLALSASAGKNNVGSDSVAGERFADPGMAMRLAVAATSRITGQVALAGAEGKATQTSASANSKSKVEGPVKIINGKRYIWVVANTGSVAGGHWEEESEAQARENAKVVPSNRPVQNSGMRY